MQHRLIQNQGVLGTAFACEDSLSLQPDLDEAVELLGRSPHLHLSPVPYGLTVWVGDGQYRWLRADGCGHDTRDLHDLPATVEELIFRYERLRRAAHGIA